MKFKPSSYELVGDIMFYFKNLDFKSALPNLPPSTSAATNVAEKEKLVTELLDKSKLVGRIALGALALLTIVSGVIVAKTLREIDMSEYSKKAPCKASVSTYKVILEGQCNVTEINAAYDEQKRLSDLRKIELEKEGKRAAAEYSKKMQEKIDSIIAENDKWQRDWAERVRKIVNPTAEEKAAIRAEIACELDEEFRGMPGYTPLCKKKEYEILGLHLSASKGEIKNRFRELALKYHPDKNNSAEANEKFLEIQNAYNRLLSET